MSHNMADFDRDPSETSIHDLEHAAEFVATTANQNRRALYHHQRVRSGSWGVGMMTGSFNNQHRGGEPQQQLPRPSPLRKRANTAQARVPSSSTTTSGIPKPLLIPARTFPPADRNDGTLLISNASPPPHHYEVSSPGGSSAGASSPASAAADRRVFFSNSRENPSERAMRNIPESQEFSHFSHEEGEEEVKEEILAVDTTTAIVDEQTAISSNDDNLMIKTPSGSQELSTSRWSDSELAHSEFDDNYNNNDENDEGGDDGPQHGQQKKLCGVELPIWCNISWNRVAIWVVEKAPCFFCVRMQHSTYRSVLMRLNILCAVFATVQVVAAVLWYVLLQSPTITDRDIEQNSQEIDFQDQFEVLTNLWNLNGSIFMLGVLSVVVLFAVFMTVRVIQIVNLKGAIRFLWVILWVLPLEFFWIIGLFDYFQVTTVWVKFWWRDRSMAWFRARFCEPRESANEKCVVPVYEDGERELTWCKERYTNATNCTEIRDEAQKDTVRFMNIFYYCNAVWAIFFVILLFLVVKTLESIISRPLVNRSKEANIPAWLLLPTIGCCFMGSLFAFSTTSVLNTRSASESEASWLGPLFMSAGGLFFLAALLALYLGSASILSTRDKRRKSFAVILFIAISVALLVILTTIFSASIVFTLSLGELQIDDGLRGAIACFIDQSGACTGCDNDIEVERCPEWSREDVTVVLQSQAKSGSALAAIFLIYASGILRYGLNLRRHIISYQIEYV